MNLLLLMFFRKQQKNQISARKEQLRKLKTYGGFCKLLEKKGIDDYEGVTSAGTVCMAC